MRLISPYISINMPEKYMVLVAEQWIKDQPGNT